ncbi:unnamed protein product, partial [Prorocentrum cordatum]
PPWLKPCSLCRWPRAPLARADAGGARIGVQRMESTFVTAFNSCGSPKDVQRNAEAAGLSASDAARLLYSAGDRVSVDLLGQCLGDHRPFGRPFEEAAVGWYVEQPLSNSGQPCCIHCGVLGDQEGQEVLVCEGCRLISFCRRCHMTASRQGHVDKGWSCFGRACAAAIRESQKLPRDVNLDFDLKVGGRYVDVTVPKDSLLWERASPFRTEDAVMILSFAIIMLTTNLHSVKIKKEKKMQKHEFLAQLREQNDGSNFPGDFLSQIYDNIKQNEFRVDTASTAPSRPPADVPRRTASAERRFGHRRVRSDGGASMLRRSRPPSQEPRP